MKSWTKYDKDIDNRLKKATNDTATMLGPYKMFCYSIKLAKEDLNKGPPLAKAMKYQRVVDQLNMLVNLLNQASCNNHKKQFNPKRQGTCRSDVCYKCDP